jgi:DNA-binding NtrC family response regulator
MSDGIALLVEDDPAYLDQFKTHFEEWLLKRHRLEFKPTDSDRAALRYLKSKHGETVKLIIVDIVLPVSAIPALGLLRHVSRKHPTIKRIAITGVADRTTVWQMADEQLLDGYIDKSKDDATLKREITRVLRAPRKADLSASVAQAVRAYLKKNPEVGQQKIHGIGETPITLEEIAEEIERRTEFGKKQERLILELTLRQWSRGNAEK